MQSAGPDQPLPYQRILAQISRVTRSQRVGDTGCRRSTIGRGRTVSSSWLKSSRLLFEHRMILPGYIPGHPSEPPAVPSARSALWVAGSEATHPTYEMTYGPSAFA